MTPFSALGQSPEACSSLTFPRIMGASKANEMLLFNKKISADEAHHLGLVTQLYQDANLQAEVWPRLKELSELPVKVIFKFLIHNRFLLPPLTYLLFMRSLV